MAQRCAVFLISVVVERNRARHARTRISTVSRDSVHVAPSRTELTGTDGDSIVIKALSIKDCSRHSLELTPSSSPNVRKFKREPPN